MSALVKVDLSGHTTHKTCESLPFSFQETTRRYRSEVVHGTRVIPRLLLKLDTGGKCSQSSLRQLCLRPEQVHYVMHTFVQYGLLNNITNQSVQIQCHTMFKLYIKRADVQVVNDLQ